MGPKKRDPGPLLYMRPETQYNEMTPGTFMIGETWHLKQTSLVEPLNYDLNGLNQMP